MIASYHNHTLWSDGSARLPEMLAAATRLGVDDLGISDHWVLNPDGARCSWSMDPAALPDYVHSVRATAGTVTESVRLGLEVDWFPECAGEIATRLAAHPFDYLIGSVHTVRGFRIDSRADAWHSLPVAERDRMHQLYWIALKSMAESRLFDIVGHLDLPKKFDQRPSESLDAEIDAALDAIASADMAVELNTSGWHAPCRDAYPSFALLQRCRARDIPALLSADAHDPSHLRRDFDRGAERLQRAGYQEVVRYRGRTRRTVPLVP